MYPKLKINVYFIFLNIGDLTFGITLVYTEFFNFVDWFTALRFTATGALLATRRTQILQMN
jgi:hypothetical protein